MRMKQSYRTVSAGYQVGAVEEQDEESSKNEARRLHMSAMWRRRRRTTRPVKTQELRAEGGLAA